MTYEERKAILDKLFAIVDMAMTDIDIGEYDKASARYPYARLFQECLTGMPEGDQSKEGFKNQYTPDDESVQETKSQEDTVIMAETVTEEPVAEESVQAEVIPVEEAPIAEPEKEEPATEEPVVTESEVEKDAETNNTTDPDEPTPVKEVKKNKKKSGTASVTDGIGPITGWPRDNMTDEEKISYYNSLYKAGEYDLRNELLEHLTQEEIQHIFRVPVETLTTGYFGISGGFEQDNGTQTENISTGGNEPVQQPEEPDTNDNRETESASEPVVTESVVVESTVAEPVAEPVEPSVVTGSDSPVDGNLAETDIHAETDQGDRTEPGKTDEETGEGAKTVNETVAAVNKTEQKDDIRDMIKQMVDEEFGDPTVEQVCYAMNNPQTEIFMKYYAGISLILSKILKKQKKFLGVSNFDPLVRKLIEYVSHVYAVHARVKGYTQDLINERVSQDYYGLRQLYDIDVYSEFSKQLGEGDMKDLLEKRIESMGDKYRETAESIVAVYGSLYEDAKLFDAKRADQAAIHIVKKHRNQVYQVFGWESTAKELKYGEAPFKLKDPKAPKTTKWTPELKKQMAEQRNIYYAIKELMKSYCTEAESKSMCRVVTGGVYANLSDTIVNPSTITYVNRVFNELLKNIYQYYGFESLEDVVQTLGIVEKEEDSII